MTERKVDVGVILCDCGGTLNERLEFPRLQKQLEKTPQIASVRSCSHFCDKDECREVLNSFSAANVDRLVVGACNQEIYQRVLDPAIIDSGIDRSLLWSVNIRELCAWSHPEKSGSDKALHSVTSAVRRIGFAERVTSEKIEIQRDVLVRGGGVSAMETALALSKAGHHVILVNEDGSLGGRAAVTPELYSHLAADSSSAEALVSKRVAVLVDEIQNAENIDVHNDSVLAGVSGELGNITVTVESGGSQTTVPAGVVVIAADPAPTSLEKTVSDVSRNGEECPKSMAIVIDLQSEQGKTVTVQALSAAELMASRYGVEVKLYCHNMRVAATGLENLYRRVRGAGVPVFKYESPPVVSEDGKIRIKDPIIGREISEKFDTVIRADIAAAAYKNDGLLSLLDGLRPGPEDDLQADSVWLTPSQTNRRDFFSVGSPPGSDEIRITQTDAMATASAVHELLKNREIVVLQDQPVVDADKCVLCLTCKRICPHGAVGIDLEKEAATMSALLCRRCGICAAHCPGTAIQLPHYTDDQFHAELDEIPRITVFACENSAIPAASGAVLRGYEYDAAVRLIRVPCAGKVDARHVLRALELGAEKVMILACHHENCHYLNGSTRAAKKLEALAEKLGKAGFDKNRLSVGTLASVEPEKFIEYVEGTRK